jgi:hypothetical protein
VRDELGGSWTSKSTASIPIRAASQSSESSSRAARSGRRPAARSCPGEVRERAELGGRRVQRDARGVARPPRAKRWATKWRHRPPGKRARREARRPAARGILRIQRKVRHAWRSQSHATRYHCGRGARATAARPSGATPSRRAPRTRSARARGRGRRPATVVSASGSTVGPVGVSSTSPSAAR